jgi:hypothetical protein
MYKRGIIVREIKQIAIFALFLCPSDVLAGEVLGLLVGVLVEASTLTCVYLIEQLKVPETTEDRVTPSPINVLVIPKTVAVQVSPIQLPL